MSDIRSELHEEIDRMDEKELLGLEKFLATYPDEFGAYLRTVP